MHRAAQQHQKVKIYQNDGKRKSMKERIEILTDLQSTVVVYRGKTVSVLQLTTRCQVGQCNTFLHKSYKTYGCKSDTIIGITHWPVT